MMQIYTLFLILMVSYLNGHTLKDPQLSHGFKKQQLKGPDDSDEMSEAEDNLGEDYFEGDVLTTAEQMALLNRILDVPSYKHNEMTPAVRGLIKDIGKTWKDGVVYYSINQNVGINKEKLIKEAIKHWEENTCLRFKKWTNEEDFIDFQPSTKGRCASYVGRKGGRQRLYVGNRRRCRLGNIIHEIGHSVGFFHEQSRPDRDQFIKIIWKNILRGQRYNFRKLTSSVVDSRGYGYDYDSIMHYSKKSFGKKHRTKVTIVPKDIEAHIGQRKHLSEYDILQAREMYNCEPDKNSFSKYHG